MIYIIEPQCKGYEHFSNNISMLKLLPIIFHNKSIKFFAFDSHADAMNLMYGCLLYTSPSPRDRTRSRMPSSA